jgi:hypothetical protein
MTPSKPAAPKSVRGVAILLSTYESADIGEATLYEMAADQKDIDHIAIATTREEFFQIFTDYRRAGISMDKLVVLGHGQEETPALEFGDSADISLEEVDLAHARREHATFLVKQEKCREEPKSCTPFQRRVLEKNERFWRRSVHGLEDMRHVMTAGAEVRMMNCGLAYTDRGRKVVRHLGDLLLGERGGSITSSRTNMNVGQIRNYLDMGVSLRDSGKWKSKGEYFVENAEWIRMEVSPRVEAPHPRLGRRVPLGAPVPRRAAAGSQRRPGHGDGRLGEDAERGGGLLEGVPGVLGHRHGDVPELPGGERRDLSQLPDPEVHELRQLRPAGDRLRAGAAGMSVGGLAPRRLAPPPGYASPECSP